MTNVVHPDRWDTWRDRRTSTGHRLRITKNKRLCTKCAAIPFQGCLQEIPISQSIYLTDLDHILEMQASCPCCELLLECLRKPENDLLKPDHIRKYLQDSERLKAFPNFDKWLTWYQTLSRATQMLGSEDAWPFGYTRDLKEATRAMEEAAKELFLSAESHDVDAKGSFNQMVETQDAVNDALHLANLGMNVAGVAKPGIGGREMAGIRLAMGEMSTVFSQAQKRLPCCLAIRAYGAEEPKAGAVSVRVFAFGRGPRAPLKELCHFTLRVAGSKMKRVVNGQLWYGRTLQPNINFDLLQECRATCKEYHKDTCGGKPWAVPQNSCSDWKFRLVHVVDQRICERDFASKERPEYAALSYVWGHQSTVRDNEVVLRPDNINRYRIPGRLANANIRATIRDAMGIVRSMGLEYLWVDQLCVLQTPHGGHLEPSEVDEQEKTLDNMGRIYSEASFTIVDGNSGASDLGPLERATQRNTSGQIIADIKPRVGPQLQLFLPASMPSDLSKWEARAWTFQEKVLSQRMLVFCDGFAQWQCQEAVWREDVNARDVNPGGEAVSPAYLEKSQFAQDVSQAEKFGLWQSNLDGSMRIFRTSAFRQYARCVQDYTSRAMSSWTDALKACNGILSILESEGLLDSPFLYGLPKTSMDIALLWQPRYSIRRLRARPGQSPDAKFIEPPSWSWAGWELDDTSRRSDRLRQDAAKRKAYCQGPGVFYHTPFEVHANEEGLTMRLNPKGEERLRPWASVYCIAAEHGNIALTQLGLLGQPWVHRSMPYNNWKHGCPNGPFNHSLRGLDDRHLIRRTEEASLYLAKPKIPFQLQADSVASDFAPSTKQTGDFEACERSVLEDAISQRSCGTATYFGRESLVGVTPAPITAIVLSEAQYLGDEKEPDVLGYPLYSVMLVEYTDGGIAERVGLGKVRKTAWRRASPTKKTVVLG